MPKRSIRLRLLAQRRALGHDSWAAYSHSAQQNLLSLEEYRRAECIALYAPAHNETDTAALFTSAFEAGKRVLYPAVCGADMVFRLVEGLHSLRKGIFGILEPYEAGIDHQADEADMIVVPGVAFDYSGHRIGYGKGFYDRFLQHSGSKVHLVGLCHDFQLIDNPVPRDKYDIPMEIIVSDRRIIRVKRSCTMLEVTETA